MKLEDIKEGDVITRLLGGSIPMELKVSKVSEDFIVCGPWLFSRKTGLEIDKDLGWDGITVSGSYIKLN